MQNLEEFPCLNLTDNEQIVVRTYSILDDIDSGRKNQIDLYMNRLIKSLILIK